MTPLLCAVVLLQCDFDVPCFTCLFACTPCAFMRVLVCEDVCLRVCVWDTVLICCMFLIDAHHSAISGFDWEEFNSPDISGSNVATRAAQFVSEARHRASAYRTNHLLVP